MQVKVDAIRVTLGIYSGRPNPSLELSGNEADELADLARTALDGEPSPPPPPPQLGRFYGFQIETPADMQKRLRLPAQLSVYSGVVTEKQDRELRHWRDVANLERFLINYAQRGGLSELLAKVGVEQAR
jgi:hypothetical protein